MMETEAPSNFGTHFIESELLLAIIAGDEETIQYHLRTMNAQERKDLHDHAVTLLRRTHKDARPDDPHGIAERWL